MSTWRISAYEQVWFFPPLVFVCKVFLPSGVFTVLQLRRSISKVSRFDRQHSVSVDCNWEIAFHIFNTQSSTFSSTVFIFWAFSVQQFVTQSSYTVDTDCSPSLSFPSLLFRIVFTIRNSISNYIFQFVFSVAVSGILHKICLNKVPNWLIRQNSPGHCPARQAAHCEAYVPPSASEDP